MIKEEVFAANSFPWLEKNNTFPNKNLTWRRSDAFTSPDSDDVVFPVDVTVEADDEAALPAGPVEVEEVSIADVAHLANALNDALPGDDVVWKKILS